MIDNFSLLVSHGLLALLFWRLLTRPDLDKEAPPSGSAGHAEPGTTPAGRGRPPASAARRVKWAGDRGTPDA